MDGGSVPLPPVDGGEPEPEPERSGKAPWSADDKSWDQRFSQDFELDLASLYAKPPNGQRLRIAQSSPWQARDPDSDAHDVAHTGLTVWDSSIVLAKYLEREGHTAGRRGGLMRGKVVLELGSGAGLLGLTALHLGAKKVYCTEYSRDLPVLRALEANITAAHNLGDAPAGAICMRTLDWGQPLPEWFQREVIDQDGGLDVILGADVVYSEEDGEDDTMTKLLLSTVKNIFSACRGKPSIASRRDAGGPPGPELVVAYEETTERAILPLTTFWSGLKGRCVYNEVSQPELHPGFRKENSHVVRITPRPPPKIQAPMVGGGGVAGGTSAGFKLDF